MRVVLVGAPADRARLRAEFSRLVDIVGEVDTMAAARTLPVEADAWLVASRRSADRDLNEGVEALTARELDVLRLLALGLSNRAIGLQLRISDQTVKFHVGSICGKLGAANRTDAVRRAIRRGLVAL